MWAQAVVDEILFVMEVPGTGQASNTDALPISLLRCCESVDGKKGKGSETDLCAIRAEARFPFRFTRSVPARADPHSVSPCARGAAVSHWRLTPAPGSKPRCPAPPQGVPRERRPCACKASTPHCRAARSEQVLILSTHVGATGTVLVAPVASCVEVLT